MSWRNPWIFIGIFLVSGCASSKVVHKPQPATMMDIYSNSTGQAQKDVATFIESNLQEQKTFGYVKPYIPVVNEPAVRKVWIPDHKSQDNTDVMIAGHWVYVMIQPSSWFIDGKSLDAKIPIIVPSSMEINIQQNPNEERKDHVNENPAARENI